MDYKEFFNNNSNGMKTRESFLLKNHTDLYNKILNFNDTTELKDLVFKEKIWHFINNLKLIPNCPTCGTKLNFKKSLKEGYKKYCSIKCCNSNENHKTESKKNRSYTNNHFIKNNPMYDGISINKMVDKRKIKNKVNFINNGISLYGDKNDYSKIIYKNIDTEVLIICTKHGNYKQTPRKHLKNGCPKCSRKFMDIGKFINKSVEKYGDYYSYNKSIYKKYDEPLIITCPEHGDFNQTPKNHLKGSGCLKCSIKYNKQEDNLKEFIESLNIEFIHNDRTVLNGKELDIYIPSKAIAIEYNGLYWHSELFKDKKYHLNKTEECLTKGIQLIHIFEDEWVNNSNIVKSRLKNILGLTKSRIYGRKCEISEVSFKDKKEFLLHNHLQGNCVDKIRLGLYYNDELVSLMTFGKRPIFNNNEWELIRFVNKIDTNVIGGFSKLLKHFIKTYTPKEIISYADRRWSKGLVYERNGFEFIHHSPPNWFIINGKNREHRVKYQKHKLVEQGYNKELTAHEICLNNKNYRIYDCGVKKYTILFQ